MSTADNDVGDKREVYERLGIGEYWRFDGCRQVEGGAAAVAGGVKVVDRTPAHSHQRYTPSAIIAPNSRAR